MITQGGNMDIRKTLLQQFIAGTVSLAVVFGGGFTGLPPVWGELPASVGNDAAAIVVKNFEGTVRSVSSKAKTISLDVDGAIELIKYTDVTSGIKNVQKGKEVVVRYITQGANNIALAVDKDLVPLPEGVADIRPEELAALVVSGNTGSYLLIDARPVKNYEDGHISTAVSIPLTVLKEKGRELLPADKNHLIVFYCGGIKCGLGPKSASVAKDLGYTNIHVLSTGTPGWDKAGHPLVASRKMILQGEPVILDLRPKDEVAGGYIPRAVNIPLNDLKEMEWEFPSSHWTPLVLYGNGSDAETAFHMLRGWGYKTIISLVDGGIAGWVAAGGQLIQGEAAVKIIWNEKLAEGEVTVEEFKQVLAGKLAGKFILDVRNVAEAEDGMFPGAVNIPLEEIGDHLDELPKDKEILVHCATGIRAEMAMLELHKAGFNARFLIANIDCAEQKCKIN